MKASRRKIMALSISQDANVIENVVVQEESQNSQSAPLKNEGSGIHFINSNANTSKKRTRSDAPCVYKSTQPPTNLQTTKKISTTSSLQKMEVEENRS